MLDPKDQRNLQPSAALPAAPRSIDRLVVLPQSDRKPIRPFADVRDIVPRSILPEGDTIQAIVHPPGHGGIWCAPISTITSFVATTSQARIDVMTTHGERKSVLLNPFDAMVMWPGVIYRIHEHVGELIRIQRAMRNVFLSSPKHAPPAAGISIYSPQASDIEPSIFDVLPPSAQPGYEVKRVTGFTANNPHFHRTFDEAYFTVGREITVKLRPPGTGWETTVIPEGGCISIPRLTDHHVVGGADNNEILIFYWPRFNGQPGNDWHPSESR